MYCPKCKKDIKPGTEKNGFHPVGAGLCAGGFLFSFLVGMGQDEHNVYLLFAVGGFAIGLILGSAMRHTVCPACNKVLLPENPFDDS